MKTLPERMREAAATIEEANVRHGSTAWPAWAPDSLRHYADCWEREDVEVSDREALIDRLMDDKRFVVDAGRRFADSKFTLHSNTIREILADYDIKKK